MTRVTYSAISSFSRVRILFLLQERPERTVTELCEATGLHANTIREHLQRLVDGGYVVAETEHRRHKAAAAARRGDLMRRVMPWTDVDDLPTDAVHQLDALVEDLGDAGFEPIVDESTLTVDLSPCPHASASARDRETLCAVHLGLMDGVLSQAGGPLRVDGMAASRNPERCVVKLLPRRASVLAALAAS